MILRKALIVACAASLTAAPAWAHGKPEGAGQHGKSHRCTPHKAGYNASGLLVAQTLTQNGDGTYSGDVTVDVKKGNRAAKPDKGTQVTYTVENVRVTFGLDDTNADGSAGLDDVAAGARVKVIGKVTALPRKCDQTGFTAERTVRRVVFHAAPTPDDSDQPAEES